MSTKTKSGKQIKLDIACGQNKKEGFTGIDIIKMPGVDIVHNLEKYPWPIKSESVEEINCSHYLEHVSNLFQFFDEIYRVMSIGAKAHILSPYYSSMRAWQDPTHKHAISEATFLYANKGWRDINKLSHYDISADFDFTYGYNIDPYWASRNEEARNFAIKHYWNVVSDIIVTMTKRGPDGNNNIKHP